MNNKLSQNTQSLQTSVSGSVIASELRIGNLVSLYGKYQKVIGLDIGNTTDKEYYVSVDDGRKIGYWISQIKSIEINEELLLKIGAKRIAHEDYPSFNLLGTEIHFINDIWIDYVSRVEIKGLHHLQNIFFFRNSEEFPISCLTDR